MTVLCSDHIARQHTDDLWVHAKVLQNGTIHTQALYFH